MYVLPAALSPALASVIELLLLLLSLCWGRREIAFSCLEEENHGGGREEGKDTTMNMYSKAVVTNATSTMIYV